MHNNARFLVCLSFALIVLSPVIDTHAGQRENNDLVESAAYGDESRVRAALQAGANVNGQNGDGLGALHAAAASGKGTIVLLLLMNGADFNLKDRFGDTPLHKAINYGKKNTAGLLMDRGADLTATDAKGRTPLHLATQAKPGQLWEDGQEAIARRLIESGAPIDARDSEGRTPIQAAAAAGNTGAVRLLQQHGASVDQPSRSVGQ